MEKTMPTFKELEIFAQVALCSNLTELSKAIQMSQPNISVTIRTLEQKLQEKLFDRLGKRLVLNERGRLFYEKITPIVKELQEAQKLFLSDQMAGDLRLGSTHTLAVYFLPTILYEYKSMHKGVNVMHFSSNKNAELVEMLCDGLLDMAFIESDIDHPSVIKEYLKSEQLVVVSGNEAFAQKPYYIDELFGMDWILRERGSGVREIFMNAISALQDQLNVVLELQYSLAIKTILEKHPNTISCLPRSSVADEIEAKNLFEVRVKNLQFERNFYLIYHKNKFQTLIFKSFKFFVQNHTKGVVSAVHDA